MISSIVKEALDEVDATLFHAHYLLDARVYFREGGILSRGRLIEEDNIVDFYTDNDDRRLGVLDCVFFNIKDQGLASKRGNGLPNVYGPILFRFNTSTLEICDNTTVLPYSVSDQVRRGNKELLILDNKNDVVNMFNQDPPHWPVREHDDAEFLLHCELASFDHLRSIVVDLVEWNGKSLVDIVRTEVEKCCPGKHVYSRNYADDGENVMRELVQWVGDSQGKLDDALAVPSSLNKLWKRQVEIHRVKALKTWAQRMWSNVLSQM